MSKKIPLVLIMFITILAVPVLPRLSSAQTGGGYRYFPETGHSVRDDFLVAYESAVDPVKIYGYPITEAYENPTTGRLVQYFQRAHFELHPESAPELRVNRTLLGEILYKPGQELSITPDFPACRYFPETDHQVCYAFLDFFNNSGGIAQFGYPISEIEIQNDRMVQYFQRARFEWHPELQSGQRVTLTDLGRLYFDARKENPVYLQPVQDSLAPQLILDLQARSFLSQAVTGQQGEQTIYVIVQDQNFVPVPRAQVVFIVRYPSGGESRYIMALTNEFGITSLSFPINEQDYGIAEVDVSVTYDKLQQQTRSSFRIWY